MLLLSQKIEESVYVYDKYGMEILKITYVDKNPNSSQIRLGFLADKEISILREKALKKREVNGNIKKSKEDL